MNSTSNNDNSQGATSGASSVGYNSSLTQKRMIAPDVLRFIACFFVISVHFLWNNGFYTQPVAGVNMTIMMVMRVIFSPCVLLFIILTGYLSINKSLSKQHYAKGMKIVWLYLLASAAVLIYRVAIIHDMTLAVALLGVLKFNTAPYAWYVEMYLGLYLLIPFLNILYKNIPSQNWKRVLILTLFVMNSLPALLNVYNFVQEGWFLDPPSATKYNNLIPQWWVFSYPLTYYFIGAYLREYGCGFGRMTRRFAWIATVAIASIYCLWRNNDGKIIAGPWIDWNSPFVLLMAVIIASLVLERDYSRMPKVISGALRYISGLSLTIFLVSYIFDKLYYPILNNVIPNVPDRLWSYFIIVPAVFLSSLIVAAVIDLIYRLGYRCYKKIRDKLRQRKPAEPISEDIQ